MSKTNKELAVDLACAAIHAIASASTSPRKPFSGDDLKNILQDCYTFVSELPEDPDGK